MVADTSTPVPGSTPAGGGQTFSDFPYVPSVRVAPSGAVTTVFYAAAGGTASGLYAHTTPAPSTAAMPTAAAAPPPGTTSMPPPTPTRIRINGASAGVWIGTGALAACAGW